jgi:multiple sugar transport system permease protein
MTLALNIGGNRPCPIHSADTFAQLARTKIRLIVPRKLKPFLSEHRRYRIRRAIVPALFVGPVVVYAAIFFVYPLIFGFIMSFEQYGFSALVKGSGPFVGFDNYRATLSDPVTIAAFRNTAIFTVASVFFQVVIGLALAVLLNQRFFLSNILRRLVLVPWLIPLVATGTVFSLLFGAQNSLINAVLEHLGLIQSPILWLINYAPAMSALILVNVWAGLPFNTIVFYSGLQDIDPVFYEAAKTDGANAWQRFRLITLPLLRPVTAIVIMIGIIATVKVFDLVIVITDGGPNNATQLLSTWAYTQSFTNFNFGQGAAIGNMLLVLSMIAAVVYVKTLRKE